MITIHARNPGIKGRGLSLVIVSLSFTGIALGALIARLRARRVAKARFGLDDYLIVFSMIFSAGLAAVSCIGVDHGYGKLSKSIPPDDLRIDLQSFWIFQIVYKCTINLTKASILFLYLRIFPSPAFRRNVVCLLYIIVAYAAASIVATIFQCIPISRAWDREVQGRCIDATAFWYSNAAFNLLTDLIILAMPMPEIKSLHLPQRQRLGLMLVFTLGGLVCITSIARMTTLKAGSRSLDLSRGSFIPTVCSVVEVNTSIVCACLPTMRSVLAYLLPGFFPRGNTPSCASSAPHDQPMTTSHHVMRSSSWRSCWRPGRSKRSPTHASPILPTTAAAAVAVAVDDDDDEPMFIYGLPSPTGRALDSITKTTDIRVEYELDHRPVFGC